VKNKYKTLKKYINALKRMMKMKITKMTKIISLIVVIALGISITFSWALGSIINYNRPTCMSCKTISYSNDYCGKCGKWMNPPYCTNCKTKHFSGYYQDKYCQKCGTKYIILAETIKE